VTPPRICAFCGRENDPNSRFCIDCGKPLTVSAARTGQRTASQPITSALATATASAGAAAGRASPIEEALTRLTGVCPRCGKSVDPTLPYCGHCGSRIDASGETAGCESCGAAYQVGVDLFCARCGSRVGESALRDAADTEDARPHVRISRPRLAVLNEDGVPATSFMIEHGEAVIGRGDADVKFDDVYLSPLHARFEVRDGELWVRDLGSRNGTWCYIEHPTRLADGDVVLVGSQLLRFRRLGYPGPHPPEADATRRMGSMVPSADIAVMEQLRADGSVRDTFHLSPARTVLLGRESGDWVFPYDPTMSGRHAEIRSQDAEFFVHDAGSRNGVALAVHGDRRLVPGQRVLVGDQVLRVESL
jgi:pSer/pThr/pTyr-binding forkhead associated (FHA) protein/predicted amidophosphoribosyltransferase